MKNFVLVAMLAVLSFFALGCSKVPAGHVGIKVFLLGGSKGVDHEVLGVGRYWIGINEELYLFPTYQQNYTWTKSPQEGSPNDESLTFQTKEGMSISVDIGISYSLNPDKIAEIFQKYRKGIEELTDITLRNAVRDAINEVGTGLTVEEAYSSKKAFLMDEVKRIVSEEFEPKGIHIENLFLIGSMRLPDNVLASINSKVDAIQKSQQAQNELVAAKAEAEKKVATAMGEARSKIALAEADAKANELKRKALSPELIQYEAVMKWDGHLPQVSGGSTPFINMKELGGK